MGCKRGKDALEKPTQEHYTGADFAGVNSCDVEPFDFEATPDTLYGRWLDMDIAATLLGEVTEEEKDDEAIDDANPSPSIIIAGEAYSIADVLREMGLAGDAGVLLVRIGLSTGSSMEEVASALAQDPAWFYERVISGVVLGGKVNQDVLKVLGGECEANEEGGRRGSEELAVMYPTLTRISVRLHAPPKLTPATHRRYEKAMQRAKSAYRLTERQLTERLGGVRELERLTLANSLPLGLKDETIAQMLVLARDENEYMRQAAIATLSRLIIMGHLRSAEEMQALDIIIASANDETPRVRTAAISALASLVRAWPPVLLRKDEARSTIQIIAEIALEHDDENAESIAQVRYESIVLAAALLLIAREDDGNDERDDRWDGGYGVELTDTEKERLERAIRRGLRDRSRKVRATARHRLSKLAE